MDYRVLFPTALIFLIAAYILKFGHYDQVHRSLVQILALALTLPSIVFLMLYGLIPSEAGVGLLGTIVGYAFGVGTARKE